MNDQIKQILKIANCFEFMPNSDGSHSQNELPRLFLKAPIKESITFFGGSFNPFHKGHFACLKLCPEKNILIVPDRNPFKPVISKENVFDQFMELAEELKETPYSLYPGFLALSTGNPTSSWLPEVKIKEVNLLMGDDSYLSLLSWFEVEKLVSALSKLYVVPRQFTKNEYLAIEKKLLTINPKLMVHYLDEHPYMNISSSELRK